MAAVFVSGNGKLVGRSVAFFKNEREIAPSGSSVLSDCDGTWTMMSEVGNVMLIAANRNSPPRPPHALSAMFASNAVLARQEHARSVGLVAWTFRTGLRVFGVHIT